MHAHPFLSKKGVKKSRGIYLPHQMGAMWPAMTPRHSTTSNRVLTFNFMTRETAAVCKLGSPKSIVQQYTEGTQLSLAGHPICLCINAIKIPVQTAWFLGVGREGQLWISCMHTAASSIKQQCKLCSRSQNPKLKMIAAHFLNPHYRMKHEMRKGDRTLDIFKITKI